MWRLSIAMFGVAFVPVAHLLVRQLFNARIALLGTAMATFSVWLVMQSRIGWDVMPSLFFFAAGIYALMVSLRSRSLWGAGYRWLDFRRRTLYQQSLFLLLHGSYGGHCRRNRGQSVLAP